MTCDQALPFSHRGERRCSALRMAGGAGASVRAPSDLRGGGGVPYCQKTVYSQNLVYLKHSFNV